MNSNKIFENKYSIPSVLVIVIFLLYNLVIAFGSLEGTPQKLTGNPPIPFLTEKPLTEDGYYMLTVAWNIAQGNGFYYNYGIKTTGVQPLAAIFYSVPAYLVQSFGGDKYDLARAVIILSALLQVLFAFLIYKLALAVSSNPDRGLYFLISVCVVLLNFKVLLNFANGLETGLYLIHLSLFFLYWMKQRETKLNIKHIAQIGVLSGLLLLCRFDSLVILFTFYFITIILHEELNQSFEFNSTHCIDGLFTMADLCIGNNGKSYCSHQHEVRQDYFHFLIFPISSSSTLHQSYSILLLSCSLATFLFG